MKEKRENSLQEFIISVMIFLLTPVFVGFSTYLVRNSVAETIRGSVICVMETGLLIYEIEKSRLFGRFFGENENHPFRIFLIYMAGLIISIAGALLPPYITPILSVGLIFMVFTDFETGVCAYLIYCTNLVFISGSQTEMFLFYFLTGLFAMTMYIDLKKPMHTVLPPICITFVSIAAYMAIVFLKTYKLTPDIIINPSVGIALNLLIMLISLRIYAKTQLEKYDEKYMEINDPEFTLLTQLKEHNIDEYYIAIHTAYLCDRIADKLRLNRSLAKGGGYYHRIGLLRGKNVNTLTMEIANEYKFPPQLKDLLQECVKGQEPPVIPEALIVMMANSVIVSINYVLNNQETKPDYDKIIEIVFKKKMDSGYFNKSGITLCDFFKMKKYFKEEKLYYDFLRRN